MSRVLIILALLAPVATDRITTPRPTLCAPAPRRTTPHRHLERVDKWSHDERTIA